MTGLRYFTILCVLLLASLTLPVSVEAKDYTISAGAGYGGSIHPSGLVTVQAGDEPLFSIIPAQGFEISSVKVHGVEVGAVPVYTFPPVYNDDVIYAWFSKMTGSLQVDSDPTGARVYLDNDYAGTIPGQGGLVIEDVAVGDHTLRFTLAGYQTVQINARVEEGEQTAVPLVVLPPVITPTTTATTPIPTTTVTTTVPTTTVTTTMPTTTVPTTTVTTTVPTTTVTTTVPTSTVTTTKPTTTVTTTVPTTTNPTTTVTTTAPTTTFTTTIPTTTVTTTVPTTTVTTNGTTTVPSTTVTTTVPTTGPTTITTTPTTSATPVTTATTRPRTSPPATSTTTPFSTTPATTVPESPPPTTPAGNATGLPPLFGDFPAFPFLPVMGGICSVLVVIDLFVRPAGVLTLPGRERGILAAVYGLIAGGLVAGLFIFNTLATEGQAVSPYSFIILPVSVYLIVSSLVLFAGALLSHPLRWTLGGHIFFSLVCAFSAALALIGSPPDLRVPLVLTFASSLAGTIAARWEYLAFGLSGTPGDGSTHDENGSGSQPPGATIVPGKTSSVPESFPPELCDRYTAPVLIGMGGIARVFRAEKAATGEEVALKIPVHFNDTAGKCFMKEIKAWEDLRHENIVSIREANILPVPYIEMEYIGRSLADLKKPVQPDEAARIVRAIASGLSYAHSMGIIHRDIKPQNILMTPEGVPKITDWGMSKVMGACLLPTITGFSLSYAAPEQISPEKFGETDQRTDIYQLGVVFYELLTGELPFAGGDFNQVSTRIVSDEPHDPSLLNPFAYPLDHIIRKCLEKNPADRYPSIGDVIAALDLYHSMRIESGHYEVFEDY